MIARKLRLCSILADSIAQELFFASGALIRKWGRGREQASFGDLEKRRFLFEALLSSKASAEVGTAKVAHNLVKTLEHLLEYDPAKSFSRCAVVQS